jgi:hypothetical protein
MRGKTVSAIGEASSLGCTAGKVEIFGVFHQVFPGVTVALPEQVGLRSPKVHKDVPQLILQGLHHRSIYAHRADGRLRYRIKSKSEKIERVVTEDQLSYSQ